MKREAGGREGRRAQYDPEKNSRKRCHRPSSHDVFLVQYSSICRPLKVRVGQNRPQIDPGGTKAASLVCFLRRVRSRRTNWFETNFFASSSSPPPSPPPAARGTPPTARRRRRRPLTAAAASFRAFSSSSRLLFVAFSTHHGRARARAKAWCAGVFVESTFLANPVAGRPFALAPPRTAPPLRSPPRCCPVC